MSNGTRFDERQMSKNYGQRKVVAYFKVSSLHPYGREEENQETLHSG
jgi:hypothetical protein